MQVEAGRGSCSNNCTSWYGRSCCSTGTEDGSCCEVSAMQLAVTDTLTLPPTADIGCFACHAGPHAHVGLFPATCPSDDLGVLTGNF